MFSIDVVTTQLMSLLTQGEIILQLDRGICFQELYHNYILTDVDTNCLTQAYLKAQHTYSSHI